MRGGRWSTGPVRQSGDDAPSARIHWLRTLQAKRDRPLHASHLRYRPAGPGVEVLHCFVLDCSGSMLAADKLARAKRVLLDLFDSAARKRHRVALVCFGGAGAQRRFGPAIPRWWNERWVQPIGGGGGTPLHQGLDEARRVLRDATRSAAGAERWLWLLSDGRSAAHARGRSPGRDRLRDRGSPLGRVPGTRRSMAGGLPARRELRLS
jgi:magnesium chelatase subunit ChlD-like protein